MKIINLMENVEGAQGCVAAHGLSFWIETQRHCVLMDAGPSPELLLHNAKALGIDLAKADVAVLSHGHYDHSDGLTALGEHTKIYLHKSCADGFYSGSGENLHYIGMSPEVKALRQLEWLEGDCELDEELLVFSGISGRRCWPEGNRKLTVQRNENFVQDDFGHEQCLLVRENGKTVLFSGCAHNGILNVLDRCMEVCGQAPDAVVSGFHMKKNEAYTAEEEKTIRETAQELLKWPCRFYTGHCTGLPAFAILKEIMGDRLAYVRCGETVQIGTEKA